MPEHSLLLNLSFSDELTPEDRREVLRNVYDAVVYQMSSVGITPDESDAMLTSFRLLDPALPAGSNNFYWWSPLTPTR